MDNANTASPSQLIAWAIARPPAGIALLTAYLERVAASDEDYCLITASAHVRQIAAGRARDLRADAARIAAGLEPLTFCGRLNTLDWACGFAAVESNARASIFQRGPLMPALAA